MSKSVQHIFIVNQLQNTSVKIAAPAKKSDRHEVIANELIAYIYIFKTLESSWKKIKILNVSVLFGVSEETGVQQNEVIPCKCNDKCIHN